ncbi:predicted protein [Histoplasma capsulatum G186AR]|uniref:Uncharacterized protein n=1 Tax=Ajellomyces capsulatus (strain G186AR / H82 / ATCC MYA-2454 / RMSCC 2432) TaxID=447093 RepID=C0NAP9_AJECG|nr:uncharacterized protein HCBG_00195 [Histoplasma capsulatum G186AR]EEH10740.1 predicted protein [Histoplasma capsulatum G186AR]
MGRHPSRRSTLLLFSTDTAPDAEYTGHEEVKRRCVKSTRKDYNDLQAALSSRAQEAEQTCFFAVACLRSQLLLAMIRQISCEFETPQGAVDQLTSEDKPCARCWALEGSRWNVAPWPDQGKNRTRSEACSNICWARAAFVHPRVAHTLWRAHRDFVDLLQSLLLVPQTRTDSEVAIWAAGCRTSLTSLA